MPDATTKEIRPLAMGPFGLLLDHPDVSIGEQRGAIAWEGVGPFGVKILVRGDGAVIFDFDSAAQHLMGPRESADLPTGRDAPLAVMVDHDAKLTAAYARCGYMNAWILGYMSGMQAELSFSIITPPAADPINHFKAFPKSGRWHLVDSNGHNVQGSAHLTPVPAAVFDHAHKVLLQGQEILGAEFTTVLSLFRQACYFYNQHEFAAAHLNAWFLIEQVLNRVWRTYYAEATPAISNKRRDLLEGRDFTASIISQILSLAGKISEERLGKIDRARKSRNDFSHKLKPIGSSDATDALSVAGEMLSDLLGVKIAPQLSYGAWL